MTKRIELYDPKFAETRTVFRVACAPHLYQRAIVEISPLLGALVFANGVYEGSLDWLEFLLGLQVRYDAPNSYQESESMLRDFRATLLHFSKSSYANRYESLQLEHDSIARKYMANLVGVTNCKIAEGLHRPVLDVDFAEMRQQPFWRQIEIICQVANEKLPTYSLRDDPHTYILRALLAIGRLEDIEEAERYEASIAQLQVIHDTFVAAELGRIDDQAVISAINIPMGQRTLGEYLKLLYEQHGRHPQGPPSTQRPTRPPSPLNPPSPQRTLNPQTSPQSNQSIPSPPSNQTTPMSSYSENQTTPMSTSRLYEQLVQSLDMEDSPTWDNFQSPTTVAAKVVDTLGLDLSTIRQPRPYETKAINGIPYNRRRPAPYSKTRTTQG